MKPDYIISNKEVILEELPDYNIECKEAVLGFAELFLSAVSMHNIGDKISVRFVSRLLDYYLNSFEDADKIRDYISRLGDGDKIRGVSRLISDYVLDTDLFNFFLDYHDGYFYIIKNERSVLELEKNQEDD